MAKNPRRNGVEKFRVCADQATHVNPAVAAKFGILGRNSFE
jgi:hypothetical protein